MKRQIAIYARQSLDKKDSISIETQIEFCRNYVKSRENFQNEKIKIYEDKGFSGKNTNRPSFSQMLQDVRDNLISSIVVYKLDRISRSVLDFSKMWEEFKQHNTTFMSVNETFDTSNATGESMLQISMVFAEMERKNIQLRVKDNYYKRIEDGRWAGGPAPIGFDNTRINKKPSLKYNDEIVAVKYIFKHYIEESITLGKIAKRLGEQGFRSRRKNGTWDNITVARILQNPIYVTADELLYKYYKTRGINFINSEEEWDGHRSAHVVGKRIGNVNTRKYTTLEEQCIYLTNVKGIIDSKTFILIQEKLAKNEQLGSANRESKMEELAGKIKCARCGYAVKMYSFPYLSCHGRYNLKGASRCTASFKGVKFDEIRAKVVEGIEEQSKKLCQTVFDKINDQFLIQNQIKELQNEIENLVGAIAKNGDSRNVFTNQIKERQEKINKLELDDYIDLTVLQRLPGGMNGGHIYWKRHTIGEKKEIVNALIDKILLSENGDIDIIWKI